MDQAWDVIVIGAGVAGLSAAETVARGGLRCLCIDKVGPGGVLINLAALHDCPGLAPGTTGPDLVATLTEAATDAGVEMGFGEVTSLGGGGPWTVATDDATHTARAVVVATGLAPGRLGIDDEARFEGKGLSHCAACDGPLYAGQTVVVDGSDKWALQEAVELAETSGHVTLTIGDARLDVADPRTHHVAALLNATIVPGRVVALNGADGLDSVVIERDGRRSTLEARAVFAYAGRRPDLGFAAGALAQDSTSRIAVDEDMRAGAPSLFAAGDARAGASERVAEAIADGRRAGQSVLRALSA
ncbi:MAG: FAD-dependent oxidoreductase [Rhodospirillales bacterium]|nr:MAG: FAD-dependent oxidoreductase [Rhodospirillales bacterium]